MKRILIFSMSYHPFVGGAEVAVKEITDRLSAAEYEFHMVTLRFDSDLPRTERIGNVVVHRIGLSRPGITTDKLRTFPVHYNKYLYQFYAPLYASFLHRKLRFDGQWAIMAHVCGVPAALFKLLHPRVPYLLTLQEGDPPADIERMVRPLWPLFVRAFTRADAVQAISNFLLAWARRRGFAGHGEVIPNGVDTVRFSAIPDAQELARMRAGLGKREGDIFLVTTSRLVHKNALDDVIRALPLMPLQVSFIVYGIGYEEGALRTLAARLGVSERVRFMGQLSHDDMPLALAACDIFVRPSRSEGMGNSFIEAMAAGLPVIATQEGGIADFLFDEKRNPDTRATGWAVDPNAPTQIAAAVADICGRPERTAAVVENARAMVLKDYDWALVGRKMESLFRETFR